MELRHVRYFLAVAEELNFTRAAARVGIGQPPLSQQIRDLEREIGSALFRRLPHGAELTDAGRAFFKEARMLVAQAERAKLAAQRAARGETGTLRVGFTSSATFNAVVPAAIRAFRGRYPDVALTLEEARSFELIERLESDEVDAAFIRPASSQPQAVRLQTVSKEPMVIALPSGHPLALQNKLTLASLAQEPFVLFGKSGLLDEIVSACRRSGFEPILGQEAPQIASVVNMVAAGLGVALVPASIAQIKVAGVVYKDIDGEQPTAILVLATRRDDHSTVVKNFSVLARSCRTAHSHR